MEPFIGGFVLSPKMMILKGGQACNLIHWGRLCKCPLKMRYMALAPAQDLTTPFRLIFGTFGAVFYGN